MGLTRPAASLLFGGALAAMYGNLASAMEILLPLYQYPLDFSQESGLGPMWEAVKEEADKGHKMTGILNPYNGPNVDQAPNDLISYQQILDFLGKSATQDGTPNLTIICYVSTNFAQRDQTEVKSDIDKYETLFPGVCDGIFFDETSADITDDSNLPKGIIYEGYNQYVLNKNVAEGLEWTVTFNPGRAANPEFFDSERFGNNPTMMSYENYYKVVKNAGVPTALNGGDPSQHAMLVHSVDQEDITDLIGGIVRNARCAGWGKIYLTHDTFPNPWEQLTSFWSTLVDEVYTPSSSGCPDLQTTALMVPLYLGSDPDDGVADDEVNTVLDVVSKSDYLEGGAVSVILDADDSAATTLSSAGARILCYFDYDEYPTVYPLIAALAAGVEDDTMKEVCGGFFVDNYAEIEGYAAVNFFDLYIAAQDKVPRGPLVIKYKDPDQPLEFSPYDKDFSEVSFRAGPVIVARQVDAASPRPFELPTTIDGETLAGATPLNSALIVTGFTEVDPETVECLLDEIHDVFHYTYVMGDVATPSVTAHLKDLHAEIEAPTTPDCNPAPTLTSACGEEQEDPATITWSGNNRKITVKEGCADMARIYAVVKDIAGPPLEDMGDGVWELDATIDVRAGAVVKLIGEDGGGECNELRLVSSSSRRPRVFGNQGSIDIKNTKVFGWDRELNDGEGGVDEVESSNRGYIYCSSCPGSSSSGQCVMSVEDSTIGYLGSGGLNSGGLVWRDRCGSKENAIAKNVEITGNRRGIYAFGATLMFDDLSITGSSAEGIRVDTCSGHIKDNDGDDGLPTVTQDNSAWAIHVQRPDGLEIRGNTITGTGRRSLILSNSGDSGPTVADNTFDQSSALVRIRTTDTLYQNNSGEGGGNGLRAQSPGCFAASSSSDDTDIQAYISSKLC